MIILLVQIVDRALAISIANKPFTVNQLFISLLSLFVLVRGLDYTMLNSELVFNQRTKVGSTSYGVKGVSIFFILTTVWA